MKHISINSLSKQLFLLFSKKKLECRWCHEIKIKSHLSLWTHDWAKIFFQLYTSKVNIHSFWTLFSVFFYSLLVDYLFFFSTHVVFSLFFRLNIHQIHTNIRERKIQKNEGTTYVIKIFKFPKRRNWFYFFGYWWFFSCLLCITPSWCRRLCR